MGFDFYTRRMRRAAFHLVSMWFILFIVRLNCKTPKNPRPNIVVILIDDLDYVLAGLVSLFFFCFVLFQKQITTYCFMVRLEEEWGIMSFYWIACPLMLLYTVARYIVSAIV